MDLISAYINDARVFASVHAALIVACVVLWLVERVRLNRERRAFEALRTSNSLSIHNAPRSQIQRLADFASSLSQKGHVPETESLTQSLSRSLSDLDPSVHACVNGLIVVGLLGTLFNLWRLGPKFWNDVLEGSNITGKSAIGVAFAASFFGLLWALLLSLIENAFVRQGRERFAQDAAYWVTSKAVEQLPLTSEAAVAQGLRRFLNVSESMLNDMKQQHGALTQSLVDQIKDSSQALDTRLNSIADNWGQFLTEATTKVKEGARDIQKAAGQLTDATNHASKTLGETTKTLESYKNLSELIAEVRTESANLVSQVTQRLELFSKQMESTLSNVTKDQALLLEQESEAANRRLSDLMDAWHARSKATLERFGSTVQKASDDFSSNWKSLVDSIHGEIDQMIRGWQSSLNEVLGHMRSSLLSVNEQLETTEKLSVSLLKSAQALTMVAEAIPQVASKHSTEDTRELLDQLHKLPSEITQAVRVPIIELSQSSRGYSDPAVGELLKKLDSLPNQIAKAIARNGQASTRATSGAYPQTQQRSAVESRNESQTELSWFRRWFG